MPTLTAKNYIFTKAEWNIQNTFFVFEGKFGKSVNITMGTGYSFVISANWITKDIETETLTIGIPLTTKDGVKRVFSSTLYNKETKEVGAKVDLPAEDVIAYLDTKFKEAPERTAFDFV